jgi:tetratricopeptide (TPR) repeat protein
MRSARRLVLHVALLVILTAIAYAGSLDGAFISDDTLAVAENPLLRSLDAKNVRAIFTSFDDANYIPLKVLSLAVDQRLWGPEPAGYHVTNLLIHVANALLVYALVLRLGEPAGAALAVALLWSVHPVQVESVAWISERKNVLSTLFFLLAFLAYLRFSARPRAATYALLVALFVAALLSKINTIVLPAVMVAYEVAERFRLRARDLVAAVPLLAIGALLAWVNLAGNPSHGAAFHGGSLWVTLRTSASVVPRYLALIVWPWGTSFYHAVPLRASWFEPLVLVGTVLTLGLALAAVALPARRMRGGFWIAWFLLTLSPMLNLVPFPGLMHDRYLYMPLVGPLVLGAWAVRGLATPVPALARAVPAVATVAIAGCFALTLARVPAFASNLTTWADWAVREPYLTADRPYRPAPRVAELRILRDALARRPDSAVLHNNLGGIAFDEGRIDDAIRDLSRARILDPRDPAIALNLGRAYLHAGQPAAAARTLEDAVRLEPPSYFAQLNLARAYLQLGDVERARPPLERARRMRPDWSDWRPAWATLERLASRATPPLTTP